MHADIELQAIRFNIERERELKRIERIARHTESQAPTASSPEPARTGSHERVLVRVARFLHVGFRPAHA